MCTHTEYAEILRVGEERRDASDNIKGFLYQDLLAIELIMNSNNEDKIYVEWVEDILVENPSQLSIYQAKHYPKSQLDFQDIYDNMFYQFLKFRLYGTEDKQFITYCYYNADNVKEYSKDTTQNNIKENDLKTIDKQKIREELEECSNIKERENLLFEKVAGKSLLDEFEFSTVEKGKIEDLRDTLKNSLYSLSETSIKNDDSIQRLKNDDIKDLLLALAVQYVQNSYYKSQDYAQRIMTKEDFNNHINRIFEADEQKNTKIIISLVMGFIDNAFDEIIDEIENINNAKIYKNIYLSTKDYLKRILAEKRKRFKFLNSLSTDGDKELNWESYQENEFDERDKFVEHKIIIESVIVMAWKILYDIDCEEYGRYIKESDNCLFFDFDEIEEAKYVIMLPTLHNQERVLKKIVPRLAMMEERPDKWYMCGKFRSYYKYSLDVNKIRDIDLGMEHSILYEDSNFFKIECMACVDSDSGKMEIKDPDLKNCLFKRDCTKKGDGVCT